MLKFKVLEESCFQKKDIAGINHYCHDLTDRKFKYHIIASMHQYEHFNSVEAIKVGLWCEKNDIRLTMYGVLNQLPIYSLFAHSVILQDSPESIQGIYDGISLYNIPYGPMHELVTNQYRDNNGVFDLSRHIWTHLRADFWADETRTGWPLILALSGEIPDEEAAQRYKFPPFYVRESAYDKFNELLKDGFIQKNLIMCEFKMGADGSNLLDVFREKSKGLGLPICTSLDFRKELLERCGQDYMAVQMLCSGLANWMWIVYGGASSLFSFFPIKVLSLLDHFNQPTFTRKLFQARFGKFGDVFPDFDGLIYCLPSEVDGPSRTDGHPPLPNLRKLVKDFSSFDLPCEIERVTSSCCQE